MISSEKPPVIEWSLNIILPYIQTYITFWTFGRILIHKHARKNIPSSGGLHEPVLLLTQEGKLHNKSNQMSWQNLNLCYPFYATCHLPVSCNRGDIFKKNKYEDKDYLQEMSNCKTNDEEEKGEK